MTDPISCPFCGARWIYRDRGFIHGKVEREDPNDQFCPLQGSHFFTDQLARLYGMLPVAHFEVVNGYPLFNREGIGRPATADDLNLFMNYFKEQLNARQKDD